jgi:hypothetical protein
VVRPALAFQQANYNINPEKPLSRFLEPSIVSPIIAISCNRVPDVLRFSRLQGISLCLRVSVVKIRSRAGAARGVVVEW